MESQQHHYWPVFQAAASNFLGLSLSADQLNHLQRLYVLLIEANEKMNLTRITSLEDFCTRHLLDAFTLVPTLRALKQPFSFTDIGSGAGFPLLPLAIIFPEANMVAVESVQKKAQFIQETARALNLTHVKVLAERSEALGHTVQYREQFDIVTARAVAPLNVLVELCMPFVKRNGQFIAMKTQDAVEQELPQAKNAIKTLGGAVQQIEDVSLPDLPNRRLIRIQKMQSSPLQYPRKPGLPSKKPL